MKSEPPNPETEFAPTRRGVALNFKKAAENWRHAMRCHALMWKRQRGTRAGGLALHSARLCRSKWTASMLLVLEMEREAL